LILAFDWPRATPADAGIDAARLRANTAGMHAATDKLLTEYVLSAAAP
jgi:hypothetical protein